MGSRVLSVVVLASLGLSLALSLAMAVSALVSATAHYEDLVLVITFMVWEGTR